jgi:hypothetical protein
VATLESEKSGLGREVEGFRERESAREEEIRKQRGLIAEAEERVDLREAEIDALQLRASRLEEDRSRIRVELSARDRELASLQASRSWRMTRPLRLVGQWVRKAGLGRMLRPFARLPGLRK